MAEETLKYNIEFDRENLAAQLESIRQDIDLALSSASPLSASIGGGGVPYYAPPSLPPIDPYVIDPSIGQNIGQALAGMGAGISAAGVGMYGGAQMVGRNLTGQGINTFNTEYSPFGLAPNNMFTGIVSQIAPGLTGYDRNKSGMMLDDYQQAGSQRFNQLLDPFENEYLFTLMGLSVGATRGGLPGALLGAGLGGTADALIGTIAHREKQARSFAKGLRTISQDNFGDIGFSRARDMADVIQDKVHSREGRLASYTSDQIQENIIGFANAGGFSNVGSADEMEKVLQGVVDNTRKFAEALKVRQSDAVQIMAQLEKDMIRTTEELSGFGSHVSRIGSQVGMNPLETLNFGLQGGDLARNFGVMGRSGFDAALEARLQTERMMQSDPQTRMLVNTLGGANAVSMNNVQSAYNFMNSGMGTMALAGIMGGSTSLSGFADGFSGTANTFSDLNSILRFQAQTPGLLGRMDLQGMQGIKFDATREFGTAMGLDLTDREVLIGAHATTHSMDINSARAEVNSYLTSLDRNRAGERVISGILDEQNVARGEQSTGLGSQIRATWGRASDAFFNSRGVEFVNRNLTTYSNWLSSENQRSQDLRQGVTRISVSDLSFMEKDGLEDIVEMLFDVNRIEEMQQAYVFSGLGDLSNEERSELSGALENKDLMESLRIRQAWVEGARGEDLQNASESVSYVPLEPLDQRMFMGQISRHRDRGAFSGLTSEQRSIMSRDIQNNGLYINGIEVQRQLLNLPITSELKRIVDRAYQSGDLDDIDQLGRRGYHENLLKMLAESEEVQKHFPDIDLTSVSFRNFNVPAELGAMVKYGDEYYNPDRDVSTREIHEANLAARLNREAQDNINDEGAGVQFLRDRQNTASSAVRLRASNALDEIFATSDAPNEAFRPGILQAIENNQEAILSGNLTNLNLDGITQYSRPFFDAVVQDEMLKQKLQELSESSSLLKATELFRQSRDLQHVVDSGLESHVYGQHVLNIAKGGGGQLVGDLVSSAKSGIGGRAYENLSQSLKDDLRLALSGDRESMHLGMRNIRASGNQDAIAALNHGISQAAPSMQHLFKTPEDYIQANVLSRFSDMMTERGVRTYTND